MKKIGFIGAYDKTDFLISLAKILTSFNNRVIIVDSTIMQKAKYVVPAINPTRTYITNYEKIDIAVGFDDEDRLESYIGSKLSQSTEYDIALLDIDTPEAFQGYDMENADMNFFVTAFDMYSLRKGLDVLSAVNAPVPMTKVLFSKSIIKGDEEYLNYLAQNYPVIWQDETIYFIYADSDYDAFKENQRVARIKFRNLSSSYKMGLASVLTHLFPNYKHNDFIKLMKSIDRA